MGLLEKFAGAIDKFVVDPVFGAVFPGFNEYSDSCFPPVKKDPVGTPPAAADVAATKPGDGVAPRSDSLS